jgi:hypothetical protein
MAGQHRNPVGAMVTVPALLDQFDGDPSVRQARAPCASEAGCAARQHGPPLSRGDHLPTIDATPPVGGDPAEWPNSDPDLDHHAGE